MPLQATSGAASYDAFGGGAAAVPAYIEDFFQTYLRTGTGASATVTTGLDGSTKETLVWTKSRSAATDHKLTDNVRGVTKALRSNTIGAEATDSQGLTAFSATGYTLGTNTDYNNSGATYVDWQWVAQPKFFDVVTFTAGSSTNRRISHSLGSVPGFIVVKVTGVTDSWYCYHRSLGISKYIRLNATSAESAYTNVWGTSAPTSTDFGADETALFYSGETYVAYIFAHDAGGFGLTGTDNVISCGSIAVDASGNGSANLGYEPQWVLAKDITNTQNWLIFDSMRGFPAAVSSGPDARTLSPNTSGAEIAFGQVGPTATGWGTSIGQLNASSTYIYIAIRRGPMKVPTSATTVFNPDYAWNTSSSILGYLGQPTDAFWLGYLSGNAVSVNTRTRLVGGNRLTTSSTSAEVVDATTTYWDSQLGFQTGGSLDTSLITWNFRRAPGFFDVVCYTGTGSATTFSHNLAAVPELMIVKRRSAAADWSVYSSALGNNKYLSLNDTIASSTTATYWNNTTPTSSVFTVGTGNQTNGSGSTYVAYLFATCAGVSKVGSYTGDGTDGRIIDCGFTSGARFVLIKSTSNTGNWWVWDTARGIVSGNDPVLRLNTTGAELTGSDDLDPSSSGFIVNYNGLYAINESGWSYIFLAIA